MVVVVVGCVCVQFNIVQKEHVKYCPGNIGLTLSSYLMFIFFTRKLT
jgi:hypothetical protein